MSPLLPPAGPRTSARMAGPLFDHLLRADRRDRAFRRGVQTFLFDRAFEDCVERLADIQRSFRSILVAGCPNPEWRTRLGSLAPNIVVMDPSPVMAQAAGGFVGDLENLPFESESFDLCISVGLLDTANELELAVLSVNRVLAPEGLFLGAVAGGQSLPRLRTAMLAADQTIGQAAPHVHPRIEAPALAHLLTSGGFGMPVVDIDRVEISYRKLDNLIADLRAMGSTNILHSRSRRPVTRAGMAAARKAFLGGGEKAVEQLEILHFAAWKSA